MTVTRKSSSSKTSRTNKSETPKSTTSVKTRSSSRKKSRSSEDASPAGPSKKDSDVNNRATPSLSKRKKTTKEPKSSKTAAAPAAPAAEITKTTTSSESIPPVTKSDPSVDLVVHRIRHLNFHPKPILCIRPSPSSPMRDTVVAISRANGSVELRNARRNLQTVATVAGMAKKPVNVLTWVCSNSNNNSNNKQQQHQSSYPSLIGASRDGSIFVIDFASGQLTSVTPSGGGGIFGLASLCQKKRCSTRNGCSSTVAAGCEDGSIRFFSLMDSDEDEESGTSNKNNLLQVVSTIPTTGAAVLSLAWTRFASTCTTETSAQLLIKRKKETSSPSSTSRLVGTTVFAAVADGTIRRYDNVGGMWKSTLRMTVECLGRATPTRVWAIQVLQDGTVISGDSLGHVQFWDGHTGTLQASFDQNDSKADVLDLDMSYDECRVFASGIDSRVVSIERPTASLDSTNLPRKWVLTNAQRPHTHDVHSVAIYYQHKSRGRPGNEILCTGGVDTKLCTYSVCDFQKRRPHTTYPWPSHSPIHVAKEARLLTMTREDRVHIYDLEAQPESELMAPVVVKQDDKLIGTVRVESPFNLSTSCISQDGLHLAICSCSGVLLFHLAIERDGSGRRSVAPKRIPLDISKKAPTVAMRFVTNEILVLVSSDGLVHVVALGDAEAEKTDEHATVLQTISRTSSGETSKLNLAGDSIVSSSDGTWFATMCSSSQLGVIEVFRKNASDGFYQSWWKVPELDMPHTAAAFLATKAPQLVVACSNYAFYIFDLESRSLSEWSEQAGFPVSKSLPSELANRADVPVRIGINPNKPSQFFLVSDALCSKS